MSDCWDVLAEMTKTTKTTSSRNGTWRLEQKGKEASPFLPPLRYAEKVRNTSELKCCVGDTYSPRYAHNTAQLSSTGVGALNNNRPIIVFSHQ